MKLGMICYNDFKTLNLDVLKKIKNRGLDFAEYCVNVGTPIEDFTNNSDLLKQASSELGLEVGSIGRWGSPRISVDGKISDEELKNDMALIDSCNDLNCGVFVTACNYIESLSLYENAGLAIQYFERLLDHASKYDVKVAIYNCHWENFLHDEGAWELVLGHLKDLYIKHDPSHSFYAGYDYLKEAKNWGKRFAHVHIKGGLIVDGERLDDPPAGLDQIDWRAYMGALYNVGYTGNLSIEPHSETWTGDLGEKGLDYTANFIRQFIF